MFSRLGETLAHYCISKHDRKVTDRLYLISVVFDADLPDEHVRQLCCLLGYLGELVVLVPIGVGHVKLDEGDGERVDHLVERQHVLQVKWNWKFACIFSRGAFAYQRRAPLAVHCQRGSGVEEDQQGKLRQEPHRRHLHE